MYEKVGHGIIKDTKNGLSKQLRKWEAESSGGKEKTLTRANTEWLHDTYCSVFSLLSF